MNIVTSFQMLSNICGLHLKSANFFVYFQLMGVPPAEGDLSGQTSTLTNLIFFGVDQVQISRETGRSKPKTDTTGGGQGGGRGRCNLRRGEGCPSGGSGIGALRRRPPGGHASYSLLQPQRQCGRRKRAPQQRAWHGLLSQSQQGLGLRPRARPHCGSAGLAPTKNTFEAAAPGSSPGDRGDLETGTFCNLDCLFISGSILKPLKHNDFRPSDE